MKPLAAILGLAALAAGGVAYAHSKGASSTSARTVTGKSGRTYRVAAGASAPNFVTSSVFYGIGGGDVMLIQYRQYTSHTPPTAQSGTTFNPGDRELVFRAPISPVSAADDPASDAIRDFGPFLADNGLT